MLPVGRSVSAVKVSVKVDYRAQIDKLDNYEEQDKVDIHISADIFTEYDNGSEGRKQYSFGQITPSFSVISPYPVYPITRPGYADEYNGE